MSLCGSIGRWCEVRSCCFELVEMPLAVSGSDDKDDGDKRYNSDCGLWSLCSAASSLQRALGLTKNGFLSTITALKDHAILCPVHQQSDFYFVRQMLIDVCPFCVKQGI